MTPDVSVVIPAYNAEGFIRQCLSGIAAQTLARERFEIILVDDGSRDNTFRVCEAIKAELGLESLRLVQQANAGPASARNQGIRQAQAAIVAFLDSDCVPHPGWLAALIKPLLECSELQGVEGQTLPMEGKISQLHHIVENRQGGLYWTCNIAYRKAVLLAVGGFDEGFPLPSGEDIDLAQRIQRQGKILFEPAAVVEHVLVYWPMVRHFRYARTFSSMVRLWRKHPGLLLPADTTFTDLVVFQVRQLLFPWLRGGKDMLWQDPVGFCQMGVIRCVCVVDTLLRLPQYYKEAHQPLVVREALRPA